MEKTNVKTIRVCGRNRLDKKGKKFVTFSYTKDGETFYQICFKKECTNAPKEPGYWLIDVKATDCNIKHMPSNEDFKFNDKIYISDCSNVRRDTDYENEVAARMAEEVAEIF